MKLKVIVIIMIVLSVNQTASGSSLPSFASPPFLDLEFKFTGFGVKEVLVVVPQKYNISDHVGVIYSSLNVSLSTNFSIIRVIFMANESKVINLHEYTNFSHPINRTFPYPTQFQVTDYNKTKEYLNLMDTWSGENVSYSKIHLDDPYKAKLIFIHLGKGVSTIHLQSAYAKSVFYPVDDYKISFILPGFFTSLILMILAKKVERRWKIE